MSAERIPTEETALPRVGVFICECGGKISNALDVEELRRQAARLPGVVYAVHEAYPCSRDGQLRMQHAIEELNLERVLVAGCAPRLVEKLFRRVVQVVNLESSYLNIANIREGAAYVHSTDPQAALAKALTILEMGVARLTATQAAQVHTGKVSRSAMVIGSGLSGLTAALALAEQKVPVILVESAEQPGENLPDLSPGTRSLTQERLQAALNHPAIKIITRARLTSVQGHPGEYQVWVQQRGQTNIHTVGAIIVANVANPKQLGSSHWFDRSRVRTQAEFAHDLAQAEENGTPLGVDRVVMIFCAEETQRQRCSRVCCATGIRQALKVKELNPNAEITVLFRELYLGAPGSPHEAELVQARKQGVTFFRYRRDHPPVIGNDTVDVLDTLTGEPVRLPFDRVVMTMPLVPVDDTRSLAALLSLPQDEDGFLAEPRVRLRPGRYVDPGIYVLGSAQHPADTTEALFQAYLTSARAVRFLNQETIVVDTPVAEIDASLCTGCGNCPQVCPTYAITLERRDGILSVSEVDPLRCIGCGNCVVVCPVKAITLPGWDNVEIPAQISAALAPDNFQPGDPRILVLACEWSAAGAAELAGSRRADLPENAVLLRMNCSARFDPYHILWAFLQGADGVLLGACPPGECHYGMGNLYARERVEVLKKELAARGVDPRRLRLEFLSVDDGLKFARIVNDFMEEVEHQLADRGQMPSGVRMPIRR